MPKLAISMKQEAEDSKLFVVFTDLGYSVELNQQKELEGQEEFCSHPVVSAEPQSQSCLRQSDFEGSVFALAIALDQTRSACAKLCD